MHFYYYLMTDNLPTFYKGNKTFWESLCSVIPVNLFNKNVHYSCLNDMTNNKKKCLNFFPHTKKIFLISSSSTAKRNSAYIMQSFIYVSMCERHSTDAENIKAEALADGLVDKLVRKAVKAHMASKRQGPDSFILWNKFDRKSWVVTLWCFFSSLISQNIALTNKQNHIMHRVV